MKRLVWLLMPTVFCCYAALYIMFLNIPMRYAYKDGTKAERPVNAGKGNCHLPVVRPNPKYASKEAELLKFIEKHLMDEKGGIRSNTREDKYGTEYFSESVGLLMDYSVLRGRKDLFDKVYSFFKSRLLVDGRYIKWKSGRDEVTCNAAVDDLRIVRALLDAYDLWGAKEYYDTAGFVQEAMFEKQVSEDRLYELYDWKSGRARAMVPLCYLDAYTMERLSGFNENWRIAADKALMTINNGRMDNTPFFNKYFDYETSTYSPDEELSRGKGICLTYTIYTVLHLAEMNENTDFFADFLKREMRKGKLYAWYNPGTLKPASDLESTAVYALASIYCKRVGETELCYKLLDRMLKFMVTDRESIYYGGFGNSKRGEFHSFDNLTALKALAEAP